MKPVEGTDKKLQTLKTAYIVLAVLVGLLGVAVHFLFREDLIALGLIVLASIVVLVGSWMWAGLYRQGKLKGLK